MIGRIIKCLIDFITKSPRERALERRQTALYQLEQDGKYNEILFQGGYDPVRAANDTLGLLSGEPMDLDRLAAIRRTDGGSFLSSVVVPRIGFLEADEDDDDYYGGYDDDVDDDEIEEELDEIDLEEIKSIVNSFDSDLRRDLFAVGLSQRAFEHGAEGLEQKLNEQGVTDACVHVEMAAVEREKLTSDGYAEASRKIKNAMHCGGLKSRYFEHRDRELDQRIEDAQYDAFVDVKHKLPNASGDDDVKLVTTKQKRRTKPLRQRKKEIGEEFDTARDKALKLLEQGNSAEAYDILAKLGYDGEDEIRDGLDALKENLEPIGVFARLMKHAHVDKTSLWKREVELFYRAEDQSYAVLVREPDGTTHIWQGKARRDALPNLANDIVSDLQYWDTKRPHTYRPIQVAINNIVEDALARDHRKPPVEVAVINSNVSQRKP